MAIPEPRYLGDGVYASFDGFHICIAVNNHRNHVVAFDPGVLAEFFKFSNEIEEARKNYIAPQLTSDVKDVPLDNNDCG